jgi:hypothetical protein
VKPEPNREGYWVSTYEKLLPIPIPNKDPWPEEAKFLQALAAIECGNPKRTQYRGFAICRLCGTTNGSEDIEYGGWVWPSGYRHYIEAHHVRPSLAFQEFVLGHRVGAEING